MSDDDSLRQMLIDEGFRAAEVMTDSEVNELAGYLDRAKIRLTTERERRDRKRLAGAGDVFEEAFAVEVDTSGKSYRQWTVMFNERIPGDCMLMGGKPVTLTFIEAE